MRPQASWMVMAWLLCSACARSSDDLPRAYREVPVPEPRLASAEARARGRALFLEHCALCHGEKADGHGDRREGLSRQPRDFTDVTWRRSTSARRVYFAIREGVHGSPMPAWKAMDDNAAWDLVSYVLSVATP